MQYFGAMPLYRSVLVNSFMSDLAQDRVFTGVDHYFTIPETKLHP